MRHDRLWLYIFLSLLLHSLLLLIYATGWIKLDMRPRDLPPEETTMTLLEVSPEKPPLQPAPPRATKFVPTLPEQETAKANPNTPLESERNTALRSQNPARDPNSFLPDMSGDPRSGLQYQNSPASQGQGNQPPQQASPAQPPAPQQTAQQQQSQQKQQPQPQPTQQTAQQPPNPAPVKPPTPTPRSPDAQPLLPPDRQPSPQVAQQTPQQTTPQQRPSPQQASRPPPVSFGASRSDISGGAGMKGLPSPESRDTELGRYKQKMYRAVGSRWYLKVQSSMSFLAIGSVRVKFFVRSNGVLENVRVSSDSGANDASTEMLRTISLQSVVESAPFEPFSESMKQQLGSGYDEEFTFSIY